MMLATTLVYLYGATLLCLFAVQGSSFAQLRSSDDSPSGEFQKSDWLSDGLGHRQLCTDETCRFILRLLGSRKSCFSSCLRSVTEDTPDRQTPPPPPPSSLTANEALADCVYARCFQGDENRMRKESIAGCISGPCIGDESTGKEPEVEAEPEAEGEEAEAEILRALRSQYLPRSLRKRGYSDATDICIQFHCANAPRGTLVYLKCIKENRCNGR